MKLEVLGPACKKFDELYENALEALRETGVDAEVVKVRDLTRIMARGVFLTPGLVLDETVISSGKLLTPIEIAAAIKDILAADGPEA
jgi:small redox-active disulfide protein 2